MSRSLAAVCKSKGALLELTGVGQFLLADAEKSHRLGDPRRVIDRHMGKFVGGIAAAPPPIAVNAMVNADHAAKTFEINVEQINAPRPLIALHPERRSDVAYVEAQMYVDQRGRRVALTPAIVSIPN